MSISSQAGLGVDVVNSDYGKLAYATRLLLVAVVVGLLVHLDSLVRRFNDTPEKAAVPIASSRSDLSDNYYYFLMVKHALDRFHEHGVRPTDSDGGDHRTTNAISRTYFAALLAGYALYSAAEAITSSSRDAVLVTLILNSSLVAAAFLLAVTACLDRMLGLLPLLCVGLLGIICFDVFNISSYLGYFYSSSSAFTFYSNVSRLVNPGLFWAVGLALVSCVALLVRGGSASVLCVGVMLAVTVGLFNVSVAGTLGLGFGLLALSLAVTDRAASWRVMVVVAALGLAILWSMGQLYLFRQTQMGAELQTGAFLGLRLRWHYLALLVIAVPISVLFRGVARALLVALLAASAAVGALSESFELGDRLWLRGASMFAWLVAMTVAIRVIEVVCDTGPLRRVGAGLGRRAKRTAAIVAIPLILAAAAGFMYWQKAPEPAQWSGYIERDKWELLQWLDRNAPADAIVASPSIEDSYLLPIYTRAKPVFVLYGTTNRGVENELARYWYVTEVFGLGAERMRGVLSVSESDIGEQAKWLMAGSPERLDDQKYQAAAFFTSLLYYPYNKRFAKVLSGGEDRASFEVLLNSLHEEGRKRSYDFDFAIVARIEPLPPMVKGWQVAYENGTYRLLAR